MDPFIGEIRMFAGNYAPKDWAFCNGQILPITQNTALFSLLGTVYGGNGTTTFALPNLQDRFPMNSGQGPGLTDRTLGEASGASNVTLTSTEMAAHGHAPAAVTAPGTQTSPVNAVWGGGVSGGKGGQDTFVYSTTASNTQMSNQALTPTGGNQPHANVQPYLAVSYIIALQGVFPSRP